MDIQIYKYINRIEFRKINFLGDKTNQLVTFKTKKWFEETDDRKGGYTSNKETKFKRLLLKSSLCKYSDAYILVKRTLSIASTISAYADGNNTNIKVIFKNCTLFEKMNN